MDFNNKEQILNEHVNMLLPDNAALRTAIRRAMEIYGLQCRIQEIEARICFYKDKLKDIGHLVFSAYDSNYKVCLEDTIKEHQFRLKILENELSKL